MKTRTYRLYENSMKAAVSTLRRGAEIVCEIVRRRRLATRKAALSGTDALVAAVALALSNNWHVTVIVLES